MELSSSLDLCNRIDRISCASTPHPYPPKQERKAGFGVAPHNLKNINAFGNYRP